MSLLNNLNGDLEVAGFSYDNVERNLLLENKGLISAKCRERKTGTTIVGIIFKDGVILGADTRATNGPIVADKNCEKIHYISDYIYCCGAGTAADAEMTTELISSRMQLMQLNWNRKPRVVSACRQIRNELFGYQGQISAAFILGGVDLTGSYLYRISPHGSVCNVQMASMGSGSIAALSVLESRFQIKLEREEAKVLVYDAICAGIFNDLGSGSNVDLCIITNDNVEYLRTHTGSVAPSGIKSREYIYNKGTTKIVSHEEISIVDF